jgi:type II secretory pathway pseudopilin PulG
MASSRVKKVSKARNDLRILSQSLQEYYSDYGAFPKSDISSGGARGLPIRGFISAVLTSPVAYIPNLPLDPFSPKRSVYSYFTGATSTTQLWILISAGPDNDYDIDSEGISGRNLLEPAALLKKLSYDPTNGAKSSGDLWRLMILDRRDNEPKFLGN